MRAWILLALFPMVVARAEDGWPGLPPDCWTDSRMVHEAKDLYSWQKNTKITFLQAPKPAPGEFSPNKGYFFVTEGGRPNGKITIFTEKDHLVRIEFPDIFGLTDVKWINEKLLFMRPWWGRIAATDIIYDVENEKVVYAEDLTDGDIAEEQYRESCAELGGCKCIQKK